MHTKGSQHKGRQKINRSTNKIQFVSFTVTGGASF
jgi:hypothetical protein